VYTSPGANDHCPIIVSMEKPQIYREINIDRYNLKEANWDSYKISSACDDIPD
jgi:hypothetical protein